MIVGGSVLNYPIDNFFPVTLTDVGFVDIGANFGAPPPPAQATPPAPAAMPPLAPALAVSTALPTETPSPVTIPTLPDNLVGTRATWTGSEWVDADGSTYDAAGNLLVPYWASYGPS